MQLNELEFRKMVIDIVVHVSPKFQIDPRSYVNGVALQSYCDKSLFWEDIKTNFWNGTNKTWENLKEFEDWEAQIHYQAFHIKMWYVIMYLIPYELLYEICTYT
jgi:hypothetical protein